MLIMATFSSRGAAALSKTAVLLLIAIVHGLGLTVSAFESLSTFYC